MNTIDFFVINAFTVILLMPQTDQAKEWVNENLQVQDWQNKKQIAIEPRYFDDIYEGILNEGMTIEA